MTQKLCAQSTALAWLNRYMDEAIALEWIDSNSRFWQELENRVSQLHRRHAHVDINTVFMLLDQEYYDMLVNSIIANIDHTTNMGRFKLRLREVLINYKLTRQKVVQPSYSFICRPEAVEVSETENHSIHNPRLAQYLVGPHARDRLNKYIIQISDYIRNGIESGLGLVDITKMARHQATVLDHFEKLSLSNTLDVQAVLSYEDDVEAEKFLQVYISAYAEKAIKEGHDQDATVANIEAFLAELSTEKLLAVKRKQKHYLDSINAIMKRLTSIKEPISGELRVTQLKTLTELTNQLLAIEVQLEGHKPEAQ